MTAISRYWAPYCLMDQVNPVHSALILNYFKFDMGFVPKVILADEIVQVCMRGVVSWMALYKSVRGCLE